MTSNSNTSILALDVGDVRIGVAIASAAARLPQPYATLRNGPLVTEEIAKLVKQENVTKLVVGLPRNMQGEETAQTKITREFGQRLAQSLKLPLYWCDETLSSVEAESRLRARGKDYSKDDIDMFAAALILEEFLNNHDIGRTTAN